MPSWTALFFAAMLLQGLSSALPTDSSSTTSAGGVDNSTTAQTLGLRDTTPHYDGVQEYAAVDFWDSCQNTNRGAVRKGSPVVNYITGTCQTVEQAGDIISVYWGLYHFHSVTLYTDKKCKNNDTVLHPVTSAADPTGQMPGCENRKGKPKIQSFKSDNP